MSTPHESTLEAEQRSMMRWARSRRAQADTPVGLSLPNVHDDAHARARLRTVRQMIWLRQVGALEQTYPHTHAALGEDAFRRAAVSFLARHPTCHADLEDAGAEFASFLEGCADAAQRACAGLARIEWAVCLSFRAPDVTRAPPQDFARCSLALGPAAHVIAVDATGWPGCAAAYPQLAGRDSEGLVLVSRPTTRVRVRSAQAHELPLLACAKRGASFEELCASSDAAPEALVAVLIPLLTQHILVLRHS